jgi:transposase-like protein
MSNRFDPTHKLASNQDAAIAPMAGVRDEVTSGGDRRRRWSKADKARIMRESLELGAVVSEGAWRHGLDRKRLSRPTLKSVKRAFSRKPRASAHRFGRQATD